MKFFTKGILCLSLFATTIVHAQDPHFSQFYLSPLTLDPSSTGDMDATYRVGAIYRNQYGSVTVPYITPSAFVDGNLFKGSENHSFLGLGLLILDDKAGDGNLSNFTIMMSAAYHQALDEEGYFHLNIGLQGGWVQKTVMLQNLYFPDQYNSVTNDFSNPTTETGLQNNTSYFDFAAGVGVSGSLSDNSEISFGVAAFHLAQPVETFMGSSNTVPRKYIAHAGATFGINQKLYLFPSAVYMLQQPNSAANVGSSIGYNFSDQAGAVGTIFYVGLYDRFTDKDAIIPTVGFIISGFQMGIAYDINTSTLTAASNGKGAYEIGLTYMGDITSTKHVRKYYCPHFY